MEAVKKRKGRVKSKSHQPHRSPSPAAASTPAARPATTDLRNSAVPDGAPTRTNVTLSGAGSRQVGSASADSGPSQNAAQDSPGPLQGVERDAAAGGARPNAAVAELTAALRSVDLPAADQTPLVDTELASEAVELLSTTTKEPAASPDWDARLASWSLPPSVHGSDAEAATPGRSSPCFTDASETGGSPFTAVSTPDAAWERVYPNLASLSDPTTTDTAGEGRQKEKEEQDGCSVASEERLFEPSAPVAESPVPLQMAASQVSISEGPFSFETEKKDSLFLLARDVVPMTEVQLSDFYHNEELRWRHEYVDHFIAEYGPAALPDAEFAALVEGYRRAGVALRAASRQQLELRQQYETRRSKCWELVRRTVRAEARCDDGRTLSASHEFSSAVFDSTALQGLRASLSALRRLLYEEYALHAYSVVLARLQVETYLYQAVGRLPGVTAPPQAAPRLQYEVPSHEAAAAALRACCAVLFAQQRRYAEEDFVHQTRRWLLQLAAPLLRLGTVNDHLFLLHQALRCPSGWAAWTAPLLQPPRPDLPSGLDHMLAVLAVLLSPVRERDKFVGDGRVLQPGTEERPMAEEWVMLDDEDSEAEKTAGFLKLQEGDLIVIFNQLPWPDVVRHLLRMERGPDGADLYNATRSDHNDLLRLFACTSQIIALLAAGLAEYNGTTHKQLSKRMCHQLLHLVHYVTDHWESYSASSSDDMATRGRLMVEYDSFVCRSAVAVLCSPRLAVWHFLASFPFGRLTARTSWKLLWLFHTSGRPQEATALPAVPHDQDDVWAAEIFSPTFHARFEHQLVHMSQSEVYFRLTALANMAMARGSRERTFIKAVIRDLVQVSFVTPTTRELCSRSGRDLLAAICNRHPFVLTYILSLAQEHLAAMGKSALFLFSGLPLALWRPTGSDLAQVCAWLTDHPVDAVESRLAQLVLSRLDWDVRPYSEQLTLPVEFHRRAALATVSAQAGRAPEPSRAAGLVGEGRRQAGALAALVADSPERKFQDWAWAQVARLKLHVMDQPDGAAAAKADMMSGLPRPEDPEVSALEEACSRGQSLACYATLLMTSEGHSLPRLHAGGLARLSELVVCGRPAPVAHLLEVILPLFVDSVDELCSGPLPALLQAVIATDQSYLKLMKTLVTAAQPGPLIQQVAGVIEGHVASPRCYGQESAVPLMALWLRCLTCLPSWSRDPALLYLLNQLLRAAFCRPPARRHALDAIFELVKEEVGGRQPAGLASLISWVSGGALQPLLPATSLPDVPWLAWFCLRAETRTELESGLWHDLIATLCEERQLPLDQALKQVCSQQRLPQTPVQQLALYRWAQQALDTELDCPLLPVLWQDFFSLYLARVYDLNGRDLGSVGNRFFEGLVNVQYMKRVKRRLQEAHQHYAERAEQSSVQEGQVIDGEVEQLQRLARLFSAFSLWLEEPRLHRPDMSLPDLPPTYNPAKLVQLLEAGSQGDVWEEYVNYWSESRLSEACLRQRAASHHYHRASGSAGNTPVRSEDTPANRIIKRLQSYDVRVPPPPLRPLATPVPCPAPTLFNPPEAALAALKDVFAELAKYSSRFAHVSAEHSALNGQYLDLLPELYTNEPTQVVQRISCEQPGRAASSDGRCAGPATVVLECETARLDGGVYHCIGDNRQQAERLERNALLDPPSQLGAAAVTLETFVKSLVRQYRQDGACPVHLQRIGARLFHQVVCATTEESQQCPSVDQLLTACLQLLGQEFVQRQPSECVPLLEALLRPDSGCPVPRLVQHFTPAAADPDVYVSLYEAVSSVSLERAELTCLLLDRFDMEAWLAECRPSLRQRSALIAVLVTALSALGAQPERADWSALGALYRRHLDTLHRHQFPEHYGEILQRLLEASRAGRLSPMCWFDFVNVLAAGVVTFAPQMDANQRRQAVALLTERPGLLGPQEALDTCRLLSTRMLQERLEAGLYGLYPRYKLYTAPLAALLGLVVSSAVTGAIQNDRGTLSDRLMSELWPMLRDTFGPWLWPLSLSDGRVRQQCAAWLQQLAADRHHLPAWIPGDGPHAEMMLDMFVHCVLLLHNMLPAGRPALSHLWEHYCAVFAVPAVQQSVRGLVHAVLLTLPWARLAPQLHDAERFAQLLDVYLPEAHSFAAQVVVQLPWKEIVEAYDRESPTASVRLHGCLFNILIKVAFEPKIRQSGALFLLLSRAEAFSWHLLDAATYQRVLGWYIMSCDPVAVLETEAREPVDVALMGFLQVAAGHVASAERLHPETSKKRAAYTSGLVRMLANAAATNKGLVTSQRLGFTGTLLRLLRETEAIVSNMSPEAGFREAEPLMREFLQCVGSRTPPPLQGLCASRLIKWVAEESTCALLCPMLRVSGTIVHDVQHLSDFWEAIITALFSNGSGVQWPDLVRLAEFPAPAVSRLLAASLSAGNLFVLHLYLLQRREAETEPLRLAALAVGWITEITELREAVEPKLCLLLYQTLGLLEQLADADQLTELGRHVRAVAAALLVWGEDRDNSGLLGAIGLGRRSTLSPQFRLLCRMLAATMLCQLWADGSVTLEPRPADDATERLSSDSASSTGSKWGLPRGLVPEAYSAFERLMALRSRREYAAHLQSLEEAVADVLSCSTTLRSCRPVLKDAVRRTYQEASLHQML